MNLFTRAFIPATLFALFTTMTFSASTVLAEDFAVDASHSSFVFKIDHLNTSQCWGRFNSVDGSFTLDTSDPSKSTFSITIKADSVDTNSTKRDAHLRTPDFFDTKQFPLITFKSTSVKAVDAGLEVTGDLAIHGVTKSITIIVKDNGRAELPPGTHRSGITSQFSINRSDYGMDKMVGPVGNRVDLFVSFEGIKK